jgi:signal transduction histidine kinase
MFERSRAPRVPLALAVVSLLLVLGLLATLQYRWVGQVGEAERARLQAGARSRVDQLVQDFDREVTRAYAWLQVDPDMLGEDGGPRFAVRYERWGAHTDYPGLVSAVFVAQGEPPARLRRFDPTARTFVDAEWPAELAPVRQRLEARGEGPGRGEGPPRGERSGEPARSERTPAFRGPFGPVADEAPALVSPIFPREPAGGEGEGPERFAFGRPRLGTTVVLLDRGFIQRELLPTLAGRYFAGGGEFDYGVVVTTRREPRAVVYRSDPEGPAESGGHPTPDATAGLLDVRFDLVDSGALRAGDPAAPAMRRARDARRGPFPTRPRPDHGVWEIGVLNRAGSLEQVVARTRHRNLLISFGTLLLLGASAAMVLVSSQRARRLAAQQVEFVAGVSHELRTPVAVVCAAGENLADGLVRDPAEVRVYGATVRDEGRRLSEMIEQVLEFAGIESRERRRAREPIAAAEVVDEALKACAGTIAEARIDVEIRIPPALPLVLGDRLGLRRALQNLIQNAARHAAAGRWIGIAAEAGHAGGRQVVRITVRDRGPGIAPGEDARIFQAFYRGRQALAAGVSGSGLGLSLVQRIMDAHGGAVEVQSTPGAGSAFTLVLPVAPESARKSTSIEERNAQADPAR